ncbi:MAG TPA: SAM-dependent methyltransferase [Streptosporangiaceae bacterium]
MAEFDPRIPSIARVYDYLLGGKDNFAADRQVADRLMAAAPLTVEVSRENRQFLARAVTWAANQGIGQFIDLGCGMPTVPNTHETARAIIPAARVAYVDTDPVVLTHLRALAQHGNPGVTVVDGDVREPAAIMAAIRDDIDLEAPACLLMGYLLHFFAPGAARDLVASYVSRLAPGSYVVLSAGRADGEAAKQGFGAYSSGGTRVYNHSVQDFASFFGPLKLLPPGVVDGREWYPDAAEPVHAPPRDGQVLVGVAQVG